MEGVIGVLFLLELGITVSNYDAVWNSSLRKRKADAVVDDRQSRLQLFKGAAAAEVLRLINPGH